MKIYKNKLNKGFTLIELMVVISIIALLSSVIVTSLKGARDKAVATKFKSEMQQFITALELYKTDTGKYPFEGLNNYYNMVLNNGTQTVPSGGSYLSTVLNPKYLKALPVVPQNSYTSGVTYQYQVNDNKQYKCAGDVNTPPYVIWVSPQNPFIHPLYSNLPLAYYTINGGVSYIPFPFSPFSQYRCYSPK